MANPQLQNRESPSLIAGPTTPWEFIGFSVVSAIIGSLSEGSIIGIIAVILIAASWAFLEKRRQRDRLQIQGISLAKRIPQSATGLIVLISPYSPRTAMDPAALADGISAILSDEQLSAAEFEAINLLQSNLQPQLEAVAFHMKSQTLQSIWLLPTNRSQEAADILRTYLHWQYGDRLRIHCEAPIAQYDYESLFKAIEIIFKKSPHKEEKMVADITGGTKMMSVALAMACIPPKRRMQYMDENMEPVALDVDPILYGE